jgi:hypothetical protein
MKKMNDYKRMTNEQSKTYTKDELLKLALSHLQTIDAISHRLLIDHYGKLTKKQKKMRSAMAKMYKTPSMINTVFDI